MKNKKNTKTIVMLGRTLMVIGATALPSSANFLASSLATSFLPSSLLSLNSWLSPITGLQSQFLNFFTNFQNSLAAWGSQLQGQVISVTLGPLGLPDLSNFELDLESIFTQNGEYITLDEAQHTGIRQATRTHAQQTLSGTGQQEVINRQTQIRDGVTALDAQAIAAQGEFVTQNILKRLAIQNAQQGLLLGTVGSEITNLSVKQDLANYNLANISEGIDSQNLARQTDMEGASLSVLQTASLLRMN
jgi:hypothetical protein